MDASARPRGRGLRAADVIPLALGLSALAVGTAFGWDARMVDAIVTPPALVRAALVAVAVVAGFALLLAALGRMRVGSDDLPAMIRGVRLAFLAVASFAASAGWVLGHPLPIVVALLIAGVDVIETSFLLLVVRGRGRR